MQRLLPIIQSIGHSTFLVKVPDARASKISIAFCMNIFYNVIAYMNLMRVNARIMFWADRKILVHQTAGRHPPFLLYKDISRGINEGIKYFYR